MCDSVLLVPELSVLAALRFSMASAISAYQQENRTGS